PYNGMQYFGWSQAQVGAMVLDGWSQKVKPTGHGGAYTPKDLALAILHGIVNADSPEFRDWLLLMKQTVPYWSKDWTVSTVDFSQKFTQGNLAILESGTWEFGLLKANNLINFDWGTFFMP